MKTIIRLFLMLFVAGSALSPAGASALSSGQTAPGFTLKDLSGKPFALDSVRGKPLTVLYFFDVASHSSQEGLLSLNDLAKEHPGEVSVVAITLSPKDKVSQFASGSSLRFPVLLDTGEVSGLYQARQVLPVVCIIGPKLKTLDYIQGGGKSSLVMLERLAERELQRKKTKIAKAVSREVVKKNPQSVRGKSVRGYAELKEGHLKEAEQVFQELANQGGAAEVAGKEGLAAVYTRRGQYQKALALIREVEKLAPERSYVHVLEGNILAAQNKKKEAESSYRKAIAKKETEPYHEAVRYNQLGRLYASSGEPQKAREYYEEAETIDPYYVEGTTNKGVTYEKEGKWDQALQTYRQALTMDQEDAYAKQLAKNAQEMVDLKNDPARSRRMDQLVKDLAERFKAQAKEKPPQDAWTSRPMVLTFLDFQDKGGLSERDGLSTVLLTGLTSRLNASGRVTVVERALMERLLEELRLGSSELTNPETALRVGKVLAAKLIGTGTVFYLPQQTLLSFRMIDTETSEIPEQLTRQLQPAALDQDAVALKLSVLKTVIEKYPLRGYIVKVSPENAVINIGSRQGVVSGTTFDVVEEPEAMVYKGRTLRSQAKVVGLAEVVRVEPDLAYVTLKSERAVKADDKIQERLNEAAK